MWHALDAAMVACGHLPGTYTSLCYPDRKLWVFKACEPLDGVPAIGAFSLCDGKSFVCPFVRIGDLVGDSEVTFLPGPDGPAYGAPL